MVSPSVIDATVPLFPCGIIAAEMLIGMRTRRSRKTYLFIVEKVKK